MTAPANPASALALVVTCGELVVALPALEVRRVYLAEEVTARPLEAPLWAVAADGTEHGAALPGWDLAGLLGLRRASARSVWIALEPDGRGRSFAIACDRSLIVAPLTLALPLRPALFTSRPGAVRGAFFTMEELGAELAPTGFLLSTRDLLTAEELASASTATSTGKLKW